MNRQNFLADEPWDTTDEETRRRVFWRPDGATMGATLIEVQPGATPRLHMHYGAEELFFVVSGRPTFRDATNEEQLEPGDYVFCPDGRRGVHTFENRTDRPARILAFSAGSFPDVVAYPENGYAWVATRDPDLDDDEVDPGIIARFELPTE
jgi:uncharacterized cupin superfamily protein